jgi:hypothetical protein
MLAWIGSLLAGHAPTRRRLRQRGHMSIHALATMIKHLVIVRAGEIVRPRPRGKVFKHGRDMSPRHVVRSLTGSRLRRALNHRDPAKRIALLIHALKHLDTWAERLAHRARRGFRRLFAIAPAPTPAIALLSAPALAPARADSS